MGLRKPTRVALAKFYLQQCRDEDTTHVHGLEMAIVAKVVSFEELHLQPAELQRYLLKEARRLAKICKASDDIEAALNLNSMLICNHWCQDVVTCEVVEIEPRRLAQLLRHHAIGLARQCLDEASELDTAKDIIRHYDLSAADLALTPDILQRILANDDPPSRP